MAVAVVLVIGFVITAGGPAAAVVAVVVAIGVAALAVVAGVDMDHIVAKDVRYGARVGLLTRPSKAALNRIQRLCSGAPT